MVRIQLGPVSAVGRTGLGPPVVGFIVFLAYIGLWFANVWLALAVTAFLALCIAGIVHDVRAKAKRQRR